MKKKLSWKLNKKSGGWTDWIGYDSYGNEAMMIFVYEQDYDRTSWGYDKPNDWSVTVSNLRTRNDVDTSFKTKKEAMVYARRYMKSN